MRLKKSQATVVIVLAVIIILIFLLLILASANFKHPDVVKELQPYKVFASSCLERTAVKGLYVLGLQNGIKITDHATIGNHIVNYAYNNHSSALSLAEIENQLEEYIKANLDLCVDGFTQFPEVQYKGGSLFVEVMSTSTGMVFIADDDSSIKLGSTEHKLGKIQVNIPVRMALLQKTMEYIAVHYPEIELYEHLASRPINVSILPVDDTLYYVLTDDKSKLDNINYKYVFAVKG